MWNDIRLSIVTTFIAAMLTGIVSQAQAACDPKKPDKTPVSRYQIKGDEVYDTQTHLTWQRCTVDRHWKNGAGCVGTVRPMTLADAKRQGRNGWRLPTADELRTLVADNCTEPAINEKVFPDVGVNTPWAYWTSSQGVTFGGEGPDIVYFANGGVMVFQRGLKSPPAGPAFSVRLVRGK